MLSDLPTESLQLSLEIANDVSNCHGNEAGLVFMDEAGGPVDQDFPITSFNDSIEHAAVMAAMEAVEENNTAAPVSLAAGMVMAESAPPHNQIGLDSLLYRDGVLGFQQDTEDRTPYSPATAKLAATFSKQNRESSSRSSNPRYSGRVCVICYSTDSTSWLKDKTREGSYNCLKCYQKKSRTGPVKDVLPDGSKVQRTCTRCDAQNTSRWHRDIIHDVEVNGVVRPAFICGKCKYKVRKSREAPPPIDGRSRRVDRKGGMVPYYMPSPNSRVSKNQTLSGDLYDVNDVNLILPPNPEFLYDLPVSAEALNDL